MKLNIYDKKNITKTYETDYYNVEFWIIEDLLKIINVDDLNSLSKKDITFAIAKTIPKSLGVFKHILKDVFEGLQDEELRHVRIKEIVDVVFQIIIFAMQDIGLSDEEEKN